MSAISLSSSLASGGWSPVSALRRSQAEMHSAMERLATGKRINRASDGPADVGAIASLSGDAAAALEQLKALDRENNRLAAQEGAQSVVDDLVTEIGGLTVSSANTGGTSEAERQAMQVEADSILQAISYLGSNSTYNGEKLLDGMDPANMGSIIVDDNGEHREYTLADLSSGGRLNLVDGDTSLARRVADRAADDLSTMRGSIGARMASNESTKRSLGAQHERTASARSLIEDADYAAEVARLVRAQTLQHAGRFAAATAARQPEAALKILHAAKLDITA